MLVANAADCGNCCQLISRSVNRARPQALYTRHSWRIHPFYSDARLGASFDAHRIQSSFTCSQVKQYDMDACLQALYVEAWSGGHVTALDQSQASDIEPPILHYWRLFASAVCRSDGGLGGESTTFINTGDDAVPPFLPVSRLLLIRCPGNRQWNGSFIVSLNDEIISFARPQLSRLVFN